LSLEILRGRVLAAAQAAFLPASERRQLVRDLVKEFQSSRAS
jgi:hypothetical protein